MDNKFIKYDAFPSKKTDLEAGTIRKAIGMEIQSSTLVLNGTAYAIVLLIAGKMLIRRDATLRTGATSKDAAQTQAK